MIIFNASTPTVSRVKLLISLIFHAIVCREASSMCKTLEDLQSTAIDLAPELTRAVTNVVCSLCFTSSYERGDPEFEAMLRYSQGIVDTVAKDSLVDIFPWLQVQRLLNPHDAWNV